MVARISYPSVSLRPTSWRSQWKRARKEAAGLRRVADLQSTHVAWAGPSELDAEPIMLVIMRGGNDPSENGKTGDVLQVAVMSQREPPGYAYRNGRDGSVCPQACVHRSKLRGGMGTCYVDKAKLRAAWNNAKRLVQAGVVGVAPEFWHGAIVRLGSEGDPAAVPRDVLVSIVSQCAAHTGYTARWRTLDRAEYGYLMASCATVADAEQARAAGWRIFAAGVTPDDEQGLAEMLPPCPADAMPGRVQCVSCLGCGGERPNRPAWPAHPGFMLPIHGILASNLRRKWSIS